MSTGATSIREADVRGSFFGKNTSFPLKCRFHVEKILVEQVRPEEKSTSVNLSLFLIGREEKERKKR